MNRTDRLYALVEELRAVAPRPRSARWLAGRYSVAERTIRRDIDALQQAGVPIYPEPGRRGGYALDKTHTLPPVNITPREAVAVALALAAASTPYRDAARSALAKLVAVMPRPHVEAAREMAGRIRLAVDPVVSIAPDPHVLRTAEAAVAERLVLWLDYVDRHSVPSRRTVEPLGLLGADGAWYLVGWCRLRREVREFRLDRVRRAAATREVAPPRPIDQAGLHEPGLPLPLFPNADRTVSAAGRRMRAF